MIDSHTHLELCEPPDAELVAAAVEAGVSRIVTVGTDGASCRVALAAAEDFPQVYAAIGRHPNSATGFDDADLAELAALAAHPKCVAIGETGLDYYRDYAPASDQVRAFAAQIELARAVGKPLVIHTRAADDDTLSMLDELAGGVRVILHCFSMADRIDECLAHRGLVVLVRGQRHVSKGRGPAAGRGAGAGRAAAGRDRRAVPVAAGQARQAQPAGARGVDGRGARGRAHGCRTRSSTRPSSANAAEVFGWSSSARTSSSTATSST